MVVPLITTPYVSRILGSDNIGIYSFYFSIAHYFSLFVLLGLNNYGNRTVASTRDDKEKLSINFINIYAFQVACGIIASIFYLFYAVKVAENSTIALIFYLYLLGSVFDVNWFFFGMEKFKLTVVRNSIIKITSTIFIFALVKDKGNVDKYCLIFSLSYLISQLCLWPYIFKEIIFRLPTYSEIKKHIKPNLVLFLTVLLVSLFKIMDKIMLGICSNYDEVGYYESSEKVISFPIALITALGTVMLPRTTNLMSNNKEEQAKKYIDISIVFAIFVSSSLCFGIMGVSKEFVPLFYGKGYERCVGVFISLLPSTLFLAFANVIRTQYLLPKKMDKSYIISAGLGATVNILINLMLIPKFGSVGAAIGTLFAEFTVCAWQSYSVHKNLPIITYIKKSTPFILSGITMFVVIYNIVIPLDSVFHQLLFKIGLGVIVYIASALLYCFIYKIVFKEKCFEINLILSIKKHL